MGSHGKKGSEKGKLQRKTMHEKRKEIADLQQKIKAMIEKRGGGGTGGAQK